MRLPRMLTQAFDSESKSVTFGWALSIISTLLYYLHAPGFSAEMWQQMVMVAAGLVGAKALKEGVLEHAAIKTPKEAPDASQPAAPAA